MSDDFNRAAFDTPNQIVSTPSKEQYIINAEGTKTAIVLPIDLYERLLEDLHDLAVVAERKSETPVSLSQFVTNPLTRDCRSW
jgi:hypothetical protein